MDFLADSRRRKAVTTQVLAVVVLVVVIIAGVAGYALLSSGSKNTATNSSTTTTTSTTTTSTTSSHTSSASSSTASTSSSTSGSSTSIALNGNYTTATLSPITIGFLTEFTGPVYNALGNSGWLVANLAAKQINSTGGVLGHPIKFIKYDDQTNTQTALEGMSVLAQTDNVLAITGSDDTNIALAEQGYAEQNQVPLIVPQAASPELTVPGTHWTFRLELNSVGLGASEGKYLANTHPGSKVALIYTNLGYPQQTIAGVQYIFQQYTNDSMSVVYNEQFPPSTSDFSTAVAAIKVSGAQYVVADILANAGNLYQALNAAGYSNSQIFSAGGPAATTAASGANAIGLTGPTMMDNTILNTTAAGRNFMAETEPILNACTICLNGAKQIAIGFGYYYNYEVIYMMAQAVYIVLHNNETLTRANFVAAMHQVQLTDVLGQPQAFDANGAMYGPSYFIEQTTSLDNSTGLYYGTVLAKYSWGSSLPVYNITAAASGAP
jgi:branched-chain amino acid transport system substrate-binding protein